MSSQQRGKSAAKVCGTRIRSCVGRQTASNAEFVAHLDDVLEGYQLPHDPSCPVICMDEQPVQLVTEIQLPLPAKSGHPTAVNFESERNRTANLFGLTKPLVDWRKSVVTERRTAVTGHSKSNDYSPKTMPIVRKSNSCVIS